MPDFRIDAELMGTALSTPQNNLKWPSQFNSEIIARLYYPAEKDAEKRKHWLAVTEYKIFKHLFPEQPIPGELASNLAEAPSVREVMRKTERQWKKIYVVGQTIAEALIVKQEAPQAGIRTISPFVAEKVAKANEMHQLALPVKKPRLLFNEFKTVFHLCLAKLIRIQGGLPQGVKLPPLEISSAKEQAAFLAVAQHCYNQYGASLISNPESCWKIPKTIALAPVEMVLQAPDENATSFVKGYLANQDWNGG